MKKLRITPKSVINYISTVITWSVFFFFFSCALVLTYYFVSLKIYEKKGEDYAPPFSVYTIVSPSMTPLIQVHDVIVNLKVDEPSDLKKGDIITFKSTSALTYDMTITHRIDDVKVVDGEYQYTTKGDANNISDMSPALYKNVIGKAKLKLPGLGKVQLFVANKFGWFLAVIVPALLVLMGDISKIYRIKSARKHGNVANEIMVNNVVKQDMPMHEFRY